VLLTRFGGFVLWVHFRSFWLSWHVSVCLFGPLFFSLCCLALPFLSLCSLSLSTSLLEVLSGNPVQRQRRKEPLIADPVDGSWAEWRKVAPPLHPWLERTTGPPEEKIVSVFDF